MIDILLSTYNGNAFIKEQLDSLLSQSYKDFKLIIRDDCSSDDTLEIINQYKFKYPEQIEIIPNNNKNLGSTASFLSLLKYSTSDLIMFCDQDDVWKNDKLESMKKYYDNIIKDKSKPILIHSAAEVVDEMLNQMKEETISFNRVKCGMEKSLCWQVFQNDVTGCTCMINAVMRDLICKSEINYNNIIQHDWFISNIAYLYGTKYYFPEKTIKYRQHSNNVISARRITFLNRLLLRIKNGFTYPYYKQVTEVMNVIDDRFSSQNYRLLQEFSNLQSKATFTRVCWHIKNKFLREGSLLFKLYQLLIC